MKKRSKQLEEGIRELLHDKDGKGLASDLYKHPLIFSLFRGGYDPNSKKNKLPSYIPSKNFAIALTDIVLTSSHAQDSSIQSLRESIQKLENKQVGGALLALVNAAGDDIDKVRKNIEEWYDSGMDRVSGWYKRHVQIVTLGVALGIVIALNVDSINIAKRLSYDVAMRESLVAAAQEYAKNPSTAQTQSTQVDVAFADGTNDKFTQTLGEIKKLGLPLGWKADDFQNKSLYDWLAKFLGLAVTTFAVTLGAPFWFDFLNKFMVVRSTVKPHEKSPEEPAVDREKANRLVLTLDQGEKPSS
jgi:hypothetical protein